MANNVKYDKFISITLERECISALLKYPNLWPEIQDFISDECFNDEDKIHRAIFRVIKKYYDNKGLSKLSTVLIAEDLKALNIGYKGDLDIYSYLESCVTQITEKAALDSFKELVKRKVALELAKNAREEYIFIQNNLDKPLNEIISGVDAIHINKINTLNISHKSNEPIDLFGEDLVTDLEEQGERQDSDGIPNPYRIMGRLYGDFFNKELYTFVGRAKMGKSTLCSDIVRKACDNQNQNVRAFIGDTELNSNLVRRRNISALSGVNEYYLRTGLWRNNKELFAKVKEAEKYIDKYKGKISHLYVGSMEIDEVLSCARRWYYKNVGNDKRREDENIQPIFIYDYVKLGQELNSQKFNKYKDYQIITDKINKLKMFAEQYNMPVITFGQTNRENEGNTRENSGKVVGLSDGINAISSYTGLFNRLFPEEIAQLKKDYNIDATHYLDTLYARNLGPDANVQDLVKVKLSDKKYKWVKNVIYYKFNMFDIEEINSLYNLEKIRQAKVDIQNPTGDEKIIYDTNKEEVDL